jgi:hypothetical protein
MLWPVRSTAVPPAPGESHTVIEPAPPAGFWPPPASQPWSSPPRFWSPPGPQPGTSPSELRIPPPGKTFLPEFTQPPSSQSTLESGPATRAASTNPADRIVPGEVTIEGRIEIKADWVWLHGLVLRDPPKPAEEGQKMPYISKTIEGSGHNVCITACRATAHYCIHTPAGAENWFMPTTS